MLLTLNCKMPWFLLIAITYLAIGQKVLNATEASAESVDPVEWSSHGFDNDETRYSPLKQINSKNAHTLGFAWEFSDFHMRGKTHRGNEATPLMVNGVLYFTGPWSVVYAVDAISGKLIWQYDPKVPGQWARKVCCDVVSRGIAIKQGKVFVGSTHGFLDALDIKTGKRIWRTDTLIDRSKSYSITGAPRLAGNKIVIGNAGAELGVRGYVSAFDQDSGALEWRFYTVPEAQAAKDESAEMRLARSTWGKNPKWAFGLGGTVWDSMTYDAELDWIFVGVGNGSPWPSWSRNPGGGDQLFLSSILALNMRDGKLQWHYQTTPADSWDYTATQHIILADIKIAGSNRKVLMQAPKNGFFYVLDRLTGKLISAEAYTKVNWAKKIDNQTGRPLHNPEADYQNQPRTITPSMSGGHNWQPMAYNRDTQLVYIPTLEMQVEFQMFERKLPLQDSINADVRINENPSNADVDWFFRDEMAAIPKSILKAWDPASNSEVWRSLPNPWWDGGLLTTAGNIVLQGGMDGSLSVYEAKQGKLLAKIATGTAIMAAPITYRIKGVQYIAVLAGFGGSQKSYPQHAAPAKYTNYERLLVFKLNGGVVPKPPLNTVAVQHAAHPQKTFDLVLAAEGQNLFLDHCARCHNYRGVANNYPNLWNLAPEIYDQLNSIVLQGVLSSVGMPGFSDILKEKDVQAIREFLLHDEARFGRKN